MVAVVLVTYRLVSVCMADPDAILEHPLSTPPPASQVSGPAHVGPPAPGPHVGFVLRRTAALCRLVAARRIRLEA